MNAFFSLCLIFSISLVVSAAPQNPNMTRVAYSSAVASINNFLSANPSFVPKFIRFAFQSCIGESFFFQFLFSLGTFLFTASHFYPFDSLDPFHQVFTSSLLSPFERHLRSSSYFPSQVAVMDVSMSMVLVQKDWRNLMILSILCMRQTSPLIWLVLVSYPHIWKEFLLTRHLFRLLGDCWFYRGETSLVVSA